MRRENTKFIASGCLLSSSICIARKLHELSQRWPRDAPYIWVPWKFSKVPGYAHGYEILNGLLFRSIL